MYFINIKIMFPKFSINFFLNSDSIFVACSDTYVGVSARSCHCTSHSTKSARIHEIRILSDFHKPLHRKNLTPVKIPSSLANSSWCVKKQIPMLIHLSIIILSFVAFAIKNTSCTTQFNNTSLSSQELNSKSTAISTDHSAEVLHELFKTYERNRSIECTYFGSFYYWLKLKKTFGKPQKPINLKNSIQKIFQNLNLKITIHSEAQTQTKFNYSKYSIDDKIYYISEPVEYTQVNLVFEAFFQNIVKLKKKIKDFEYLVPCFFKNSDKPNAEIYYVLCYAHYGKEKMIFEKCHMGNRSNITPLTNSTVVPAFFTKDHKNIARMEFPSFANHRLFICPKDSGRFTLLYMIAIVKNSAPCSIPNKLAYIMLDEMQQEKI